MWRSRECRPMIDKPPPFKGLNIRISMIVPIDGRGFINQRSGLELQHDGLRYQVPPSQWLLLPETLIFGSVDP